MLIHVSNFYVQITPSLSLSVVKISPVLLIDSEVKIDYEDIICYRQTYSTHLSQAIKL